MWMDAVILLQVVEAFEDALLVGPEGPGKAPAGLRLCLGRCHAGKSNRSGVTREAAQRHLQVQTQRNPSSFLSWGTAFGGVAGN